jgi:hypothetical protein
MRCLVYIFSEIHYVPSFDEAIDSIKQYTNLRTHEELPLYKHKTYRDVYYTTYKTSSYDHIGIIIKESSPIFNCIFADKNPLAALYIAGREIKALYNNPHYNEIYTQGQYILRNLNTQQNYDIV